MEDYLLLELFKGKVKEDPEFGEKLMEHMKVHKHNPDRIKGERKMYSQYEEIEKNDWDEDWHFDGYTAKHLVKNMHHRDANMNIISGEYFSMERATSVCDTYKRMHHLDVTPEDVYVAINAQYHDYSKLYKSWFGSNVDNKIIESAMCFWFKDEDYNKGSKLMNYFKEL